MSTTEKGPRDPARSPGGGANYSSSRHRLLSRYNKDLMKRECLEFSLSALSPVQSVNLAVSGTLHCFHVTDGCAKESWLVVAHPTARIGRPSRLNRVLRIVQFETLSAMSGHTWINTIIKTAEFKSESPKHAMSEKVRTS